MRATRVIGHSEALIEAQRCLDCYDAPCTAACPVHVDVPGFIRRLCEDNLEGAGDLLYSSCPLAVTCGLACTTKDLCEGACTLNQMGQAPIRIGSLQAYVASSFNLQDVDGTLPTASRVAIIGGGPSGIGCAVQLRRFGYEVHIFDKADILGGLVDRVIPHYRLPHKAIAHDLKRITESGVVLHLEHVVEEENAQNLLHDYDAVFIGSGLSKTRTLSVSGMDVNGVYSALDYLDKARHAAKYQEDPPGLGQVVVIVGGGNVALDAAVMAKNLGAERVIVLYRRSKKEMPGWESEYLEAAKLGVEFRWLSVIKQILSVNGRVKAVEVQSMCFNGEDVDGRRKVEPLIDIPTYQLLCDSVVLALGQVIDQSLMEDFGISFTEQITIPVSQITYQTENPKIFAGGEAVSGGTNIVNSLSQGMSAGRAIHKWLQKRNE